MLLFVVRKLGTLITTLFAISTLTFVCMHALPGDPFLQEQPLSAEVLCNLRQHHRLDRPILLQYVHFLHDALQGNLGMSLQHPSLSVASIIRQGFPTSLALGASALTFALIGGITFGTLAAWYRQSWPDRTMTWVAVIGISIPAFVLAPLLQYVLAIRWPLLPIARWGSLAHAILPAVSLAIGPTTFIARLIRASMIDVLQQDYIQMAQAKGLSTWTILTRHALRNALLPIIAYLGPLTATLLTGSFGVEVTFGIPGLGKWFIASVCSRDYPTVMGVTLFYSVTLLVCVFLADLLNMLIDPRQRRVKPVL